MVFAIVVVLLVLGTVAFHFLSPWWFTPIASNWQMVDDTVNVTFWVTGTVFVAVNLFLAYSVFRYRHRQGQVAHYEPENKKLEWWLTIVTSVGIAAMLAPGLSVWAKFVTPPPNASVVEVLGQQWNWSYRLPGRDGVLGATDTRLISVDNPFGIDPNDPKGQDDVLIGNPELHLPLDREIKMSLRAIDVNHQFAVPQFRVKMDMVPGMITSFWIKTTRVGSFDALCEQLCGLAHFTMRGRVVVESESDYQAWLAKQLTYAQMKVEVAGDPNAGQALYAVCSACHGDHAQGSRELNAPKLSGQAPWYLIRQLQAFRHGIRGASDQDLYAKQMIPFAAGLADDTAIKNVVAYIAAQPDTRPVATVLGNPNAGRMDYATCTSCHGATGQGVWATNAPRIAGMSDWYLKRQLQNFAGGVRGYHRQDYYGAQMAGIAKSLSDPDSINDLVDYLHTL